MADKKISDLTTASEIKNEDNIELSQSTGGGLVSLKATILALATKILTNINFTSALQTTNKTITGAINEVAQGGGGGGTDVIADDFDSTSTYAVGDYCIYNGSLYKCTTAVTTAGDWDSSDWTETLVMDEVEQGGGGGAGHTIIDENGNSMTARAGLQFVGGANVSDDSTNNKTIVDLASAGGIDGVFIDTGNLISSGTLSNSGTTSYTATEDCYFIGYSSSGSDLAYLIDNVTMIFAPTNQTHSLLLKKGQTLTVGEASTYSVSYKIYGIQTGTTHSKFQPVIYSTEEREIGVWKDGKPLYEKTFYYEGNIRTNSTTEIADLSSLSPDTILPFKTTIDEAGWAVVDLPCEGFRLQISYTNKKVSLINSSNLSFQPARVNFVVQYTKTTDTAGSGDWTPQGVPAVHYSTDEQIIGTWIDDKPLYQKTIVKTSGITQNGWTEMTTDTTLNVLGYDISTSYIVLSSGGMIPIQEYQSSERIQRFQVASDKKAKVFFKNDTYTATKIVLTIRYTKSS